MLIAIVALTVLFDYYRLYRKTYDELNVAFKDQKIEYGSDISAHDLIVGTYEELTVDQDLDTFQVGEQELIVTAKAESPRYRQTVSGPAERPMKSPIPRHRSSNSRKIPS